MEPPCCAWYLCRAPTNLGWHQFPSSSIDDEFNDVLKMPSETRKTEKSKAYQKIEDYASRSPQFCNYFLSSVGTNSEVMAANLPKKQNKNSTKFKQYALYMYVHVMFG